jgi:dTDP-4-dehydrorhamnose reductase
VLDLLEQPIEGTFNAVAQGHASRYEYVRAIVEASGLPCTVNPGPAFARRAKVSSNECATNAKLQSLGLDHMPQWQGALTHYVKELMATSAWQERNQAAVSATRQS